MHQEKLKKVLFDIVSVLESTTVHSAAIETLIKENKLAKEVDITAAVELSRLTVESDFQNLRASIRDALT